MNKQNPATPETEPTRRAAAKAGSMDQVTRRNVEASRKLEDSTNRERSRRELIAERVTNFCSSLTLVKQIRDRQEN